MLDRDLAMLYVIPTKALKQAVRRNPERFPEDFMFVLDTDELSHWRSQFVTSKEDRKGLRYAPMAFTEQGVAMLSSVLNSPGAVQVNIAIMRTRAKNKPFTYATDTRLFISTWGCRASINRKEYADCLVGNGSSIHYFNGEWLGGGCGKKSPLFMCPGTRGFR